MYLIGKGNKEKTCNLYKRISCILGAPIGLLLKSSLLEQLECKKKAMRHYKIQTNEARVIIRLPDDIIKFEMIACAINKI